MPRKSNPINDIGNTVGGWLGGAAKSLNTFLTGDKNPTINPTTRRAIGATQEVADVLSGGGVAAAKAGPDAFQRYAVTQGALAIGAAGVGAALPKVVSAAANTNAGKYAINKAADAAYQARMLKPVTTRNSLAAQRKLLNQVFEAKGEIARLEDEIYFSKQVGTKTPDYDYMDLYESANPVSRSTQEQIAALGDDALSRGRKNRMLMDTAKSAYQGIDEDWNAEEVRFAKRFLRERGRVVSRVLQKNQQGAYLKRIPADRRAEFIQRQSDLKAKKLQRLLDISNARRNMPENYIDPQDFFK